MYLYCQANGISFPELREIKHQVECRDTRAKRGRRRTLSAEGHEDVYTINKIYFYQDKILKAVIEVDEE